MPETRNDEMTLKDLLALLWGNRLWIAVSVVACTVVAVFYALTELPVYQTDALLQLETKSKNSGANALGAMADLFQTTNPAETEIEVIKSRLVLGRASERLKLDLQAVPLKWGRLARLLGKPRPTLELERLDVRKEWYGKPFVLELLGHGRYALHEKSLGKVLEGTIGVGIDSASNPYRVGVFVSGVVAHTGDRFVVMHNDPLVGIGFLRTSIGVAEVGKKTGIIGLTFSGGDPYRIVEILNEIANAYVRQDVEQKSAEAEKTLQFLQEQLPDLKRSLEASEQRLNQYRSSMGSIDLSEEAKLALNQQVEVQQKLFETQQKRKEALQLFKADHPNVLTLDSAIASLTGKLNRQESQVKALPMQQQEVVRLMRDVQVNTELYTGLLNNSQQLKVVKAGEIGNVRVIDYAVPQLLPTKPNRRNIILVGVMVGFALGAGLALVRKMLQRGVSDPRQVEASFNLPVYALVPHSEEQVRLRRIISRGVPGVHVLGHSFPEDLAMESLRSLRTTLQFALADAPNRILVLTGPSSGIGKSFVSANAAVVMAKAGMRVLLVDGDMRRGKLHASFGQKRGAGLSEVLAGSNEMAEVIEQPIDGLSLWFLSSGTLPPNPSELLHSKRSQDLMADWAKQYDMVVVDAPPVLAVTDAAILAGRAGATLVVLKAGQHPLGEIEATLLRLRQSGIDPKGAIFNDIRRNEVGQPYQYGYRYERDRDA